MVDAPLRTLADLTYRVRERSAGRSRLLSVRREGRLETLSTGEFVAAVHGLALALDARGIKRGDRIAIWSANAPEWHIVDFACHLLGAVSVPAGPGLPARRVAWILNNSGARWLFLGRRQAARLEEVVDPIGTDVQRVALEDDPRPDHLPLTRLLGEGQARRGDVPLDRLRGAVDPEDLASILYPGGSTGDSRGVEVTHQALVSSLLGCAERFDVGPDDLALSFLPLSEAFERTVAYLFFLRGVPIHYAPAVERVPALLARERPTVLSSVPRLFEQTAHRSARESRRRGPVARAVYRWALSVGRRRREARSRGQAAPLLALQESLARALALRSLRREFGGRLRFALSGGAPLRQGVAELFDTAGIPLYQGYGKTEVLAIVSVNHPGAHRLGSVGSPLRGVEVRIREDGEILVRGPGCSRGYWADPGPRREAVGDDGWLATGDLGHVDPEGFLWITGRKTETLVTSTGHRIVPAVIEKRLEASPYVQQAVVVGEGHPYPAALLVPDLEALREAARGPENDEAAEPRGIDSLLDHPITHQVLEAAVAAANRHLGDPERVRRYEILDQPLSRERGEVGEDGRPLRRVVAQRYAEIISRLHPDAGRG